MDTEQFESTQRYIEFDGESQRRLTDFLPHARPHFAAIIDDFYETIEAHPDARQAITGGQQQIERLKGSLTLWIERVLGGPHDASYLAAHSRIGQVHVRIALPQQFMLTAMNRVRVRLLDIARQALGDDPNRLVATQRAINQVLDLDLAIMLDSYRQHQGDKVRAAARLATIGQLAASIGHELRNPLGIVESSLFLMSQRMTKLELADPQLEKHHAKIERQVKQCGRIINNLLDLARERPPRRRRGALAATVNAALERVVLPEAVELQVDLPADIQIDADEEDLSHVVVNLLQNAIQAQGGTGAVRIDAAREKGGTAVYIQDEGPGVPEDLRTRIFDALFTTKARGTGLGLALCQRIVVAHGGELALVPSPSGARFRFWIPDLATA